MTERGEFEDEDPDWEAKEEEIPPALREKWQKEAEKGARAGVCGKCGNTFSDEDLTCRHCEEPVVLKNPSPAVAWFFKSAWGVWIAIAVLFGFLALSLQA